MIVIHILYINNEISKSKVRFITIQHTSFIVYECFVLFIGDIFESSKVKVRTTLLPGFSENRRSSIESWALKQDSKMSPQVGLAVHAWFSSWLTRLNCEPAWGRYRRSIFKIISDGVFRKDCGKRKRKQLVPAVVSSAKQGTETSTTYGPGLPARLPEANFFFEML